MFFKIILLVSNIFFINIAFGLEVNYKNLDKYIVIALKSENFQDAIDLAKENHYRLLGEIRGFKNIFLFEKISSTNLNGNNEKRSKSSQIPFETDDRVLWTSQQRKLKRDKRDFFYFPYDEYYGDDFDNEFKYKPLFNDELWEQQWYMKNSTNLTKREESLHLNVLPVYARGITGKNIRVAVLDDGLEYEHEDLAENYDPEISWDCNNDIPDPHPSYRDVNSNRHGTRCAGEIAMVANNKKCGVGIAFNAKIGGIKLLGGEVFDLIEGMALGFAHDKIDIYSSSWGPTDNGKTLEKPGIFALFALKRGILEGRNGLGSIYVWASGNGGSKNDNCNCDGYAASIYTITVSSVTQRGNIPWYSERCASILTVTYSSGSQKDQMIATTDLGNSCTIKHTGTSASAPLAAGIIALGLEANPLLTWRDVQHLIVQTAEHGPLKNNKGWQKNGAGHQYNVGLGFGLMNADAFVSKAINWKTVPPQQIQQVKGYDIPSEKIFNHSLTQAFVEFNYSGNSIKYLEHVEVTVNIISSIRGNLEIHLKSPQGMNIPILETRKNDKSKEGFRDWTFMSVATWSENPKGVWILHIFDRNTSKNESFIDVKNCTLTLYGTYLNPTDSGDPRNEVLE